MEGEEDPVRQNKKLMPPAPFSARRDCGPTYQPAKIPDTNERVRKKIFEFEARMNLSPTCLYLGSDEMNTLPRQGPAIRDSRAYCRQEFYGLKIYRVDAQSHLAVS